MASTRTCRHCGNRQSVNQFYYDGQDNAVCRDCRHAIRNTPKPKDPPRTRTCWQCEQTFKTTDFSQRLCSPECRRVHSKRVVNDEPITAKEKAAIRRAMARWGGSRTPKCRYGV